MLTGVVAKQRAASPALPPSLPGPRKCGSGTCQPGRDGRHLPRVQTCRSQWTGPTSHHLREKPPLSAEASQTRRDGRGAPASGPESDTDASYSRLHTYRRSAGRRGLFSKQGPSSLQIHRGPAGTASPWQPGHPSQAARSLNAGPAGVTPVPPHPALALIKSIFQTHDPHAWLSFLSPHCPLCPLPRAEVLSERVHWLGRGAGTRLPRLLAAPLLTASLTSGRSLLATLQPSGPLPVFCLALSLVGVSKQRTPASGCPPLWADRGGGDTTHRPQDTPATNGGNWGRGQRDGRPWVLTLLAWAPRGAQEPAPCPAVSASHPLRAGAAGPGPGPHPRPVS